MNYREIHVQCNMSTKLKQARFTLYFRLFVLPQYCGTLLEQCLMLNRRRNDMEEFPKQKQGLTLKPETVIEETLSTAGKYPQERVEEILMIIWKTDK